MQKFKLILLKKAETIGELRCTQLKDRQSMLDYLKSIQKQQIENKTVQEKVLFAIDSIKFQTYQDLEELYYFSDTAMKSICKKFEFTPTENELFSSICEIHCKFYEIEGAFNKTEEIKSDLKKTSTIKEFMLKQLMRQFYIWTKKKFNKLVTQFLISIQKDLLVSKRSSPKKIQQNQKFIIGSTMNLFSSQKLTRKQNRTEMKITAHKAVSLFTEQEQVVFIDKKSEQKNYDLSTRISTSYDPQKSEELIPKTLDIKKRSNSHNRTSMIMQRQKSVNFIQNINKQIFFGAFNQQITQVYRNLGDVMDVDLYHLRSFRKQREELKDQIIFTRMNQVISLMIRNMPNIQKSVDRYGQWYAKCCPNHIKYSHKESGIQNSEPIKKMKSSSLQKSNRNKLYLSQKVKSQQGVNHDQQIEKLFKNSKINRLKERNISFQQRITRKSSQQKTQIATKFPVVYNPQFIYPKQDFQVEKVNTIHQQYQNFAMRMNKVQNKGLIRYKLLNKEREKNFIEEDNFVSQNPFCYGTDLFQSKKLSDFQVANIRKLLRIREKQRIIGNKPPIASSIKQQKQDLAQVKASQISKQLISPKKTNKFSVFLSTLNNNGTKNGFKLNGKSQNFNKDVDFCFSSRKKHQQYFPKLI